MSDNVIETVFDLSKYCLGNDCNEEFVVKMEEDVTESVDIVAFGD